MIDRFRTPATGRAMIAKGVTAKEEATMPCTIPDACLCISGVTAYSVSVCQGTFVLVCWPIVAMPMVSSARTHLRCHVLLRKTGASTCDDQIRNFFAICEAGDYPLYVQDVIRDYLRPRCGPPIAAILSEDILKCRNALVSR